MTSRDVPSDVVGAKASEIFPTDRDEYSYASDFLTELRTNWRQVDAATNRSITVALALGLIFYLLVKRSTSEVSFLFVKLSNVNLIIAGIPLVIAYCYYYISYLSIKAVYFFKAHDAVVRAIYPSIHEAAYVTFLHPPVSIMLDPTTLGDLMESADLQRTRFVVYGVALLRALAAILVVPGFGVFSIVQLAITFGLGSWLFWITSLATTGLLALGIIQFVLFFRS